MKKKIIILSIFSILCSLILVGLFLFNFIFWATHNFVAQVSLYCILFILSLISTVILILLFIFAWKNLYQKANCNTKVKKAKKEKRTEIKLEKLQNKIKELKESED